MRLTAILVFTMLAALSYTAAADRAKVNGIDLYYEVHGKGPPIVVLHGAFCSVGCLADLIPALAKSRQVIAVELQGHGHTADIERPLTAGNMADDVAALLEHLKIANADVFGHSMGGVVALELVRRHPGRVRKVVLAGTPLARDGMHPGLLDSMAKMDPVALEKTPAHAAYVKIAPKPEQWATLVRKVQKLDAFPIKVEDLKTIKSPVLYAIGDSDFVTPEHGATAFRTFGGGVVGDFVGLPKSQLAVLPGTTHVTIIHDPLFATIVLRFLDK